MEIRARYILIGAFVLAAALGVFGFVYWLNNAGGIGPRTPYRIVFDGSVAGLGRGAPVLFNGIQVGEVTDLALVSDAPGKVLATIAVDKNTPVRGDTHVGLAYSGLTGSAAVALAGGTADAAPPAASDGGPPLLAADPAAMKDMTQAARDVLQHVDAVIGDNAQSLKDAIANISTFSKALSDNSDKVGGILQGLEKLTGGGKTEAQFTIDLTAPTIKDAGPAPDAQLGLSTPTSVITGDTQHILVSTPTGEATAFPEVRWADNIPALMRARIAESFENAGYLKVGGDMGDVTADYKLGFDIRTFHIVATETPPVARMEISAKVVDADGKVIAAKIFDGEGAVAATDNAADAAKALDAAFGEVAKALIPWAMKAISDHEKAGGEPAPDSGGDDLGPLPAPSGEPAPAPDEPGAPSSP
jgi:phospholipid/cholesterol/gamma-HCH transport system substrate-binding protein